ncbi:MAG: hypothetical protein ACJA06_001005 [Halocynthiibacter sp.]|jgi:hypothetical protein
MSNAEAAYAVVPYNSWPAFGMANMELDTLHWPLGQPERLKGRQVRDLGPLDHLIAYPNSELFYGPWWGIRANISVMIVEPDILHAKNLKRAYRARKSFYSVLTKSDALLAKIENGLFFYFGSTFIDNIAAIDPTKTKHMSLITSGKRDFEGHRLRHRLVDFIQAEGLDVEIMGRGYSPFEHKKDGLQSYRFSVVIENIQEPHYFTEKLVDAALCRTVPLYWGCPNIDEHFDTSGMILCNSEEALRQQISRVTKADYESRLAALEENYTRALDHADYIKRAALVVKAEVARRAVQTV